MEIELHSMWPLGVDFFHSAEFPEAQSKSLCVCVNTSFLLSLNSIP